MSLTDQGLVLHSQQPYPELDGFYSFGDLLENDWYAQSVSFAQVRAVGNVAEFHIFLVIGSANTLITRGNWPESLRPHSTTERLVLINRQPYTLRFTADGAILLLSYSTALQGERMSGSFSIPRRAV